MLCYVCMCIFLFMNDTQTTGIHPDRHTLTIPYALPIFAGQITGGEGYVESAAIGLLAGRFAAAELAGHTLAAPPPATALGALLGHITGAAEAATYQPMNVNFGLFPPIEGRAKKADRKKLYTSRAREALAGWIAGYARAKKGAQRRGGAE